jgi:hypothetical protein
VIGSTRWPYSHRRKARQKHRLTSSQGLGTVLPEAPQGASEQQEAIPSSTELERRREASVMVTRRELDSLTSGCELAPY